VVGFDINKTRVNDLIHQKDVTREADLESLNTVLKSSARYGKGLYLTAAITDIEKCNILLQYLPLSTSLKP
jgi:UDP-N-acetyl-D-mannosaminuronate dehydrogenase